MNINLKEWNIILHSLEVAKKDYEKQRDESRPGSELYRIFDNQAAELAELIERIENTPI